MSTEKDQNKAFNKTDVSGCCSSDKIIKLYLLDPNDCVYENGVMVRIKRKYGKFKRVVHFIDYNNR